MNELLAQEYYNNSVQEYSIALGIALVGIALVSLFKKVILSRLGKLADKTTTQFDNFIVKSIEKYGVPAAKIFFVYAGLNFLELSEKTARVIDIAFTVAMTILAIRFISKVVLLLLTSYIKSHSDGQEDEKVTQLGGLMLIFNIVLWLVGLLFLFSNMGYDVTAVIAGLGIGGIAIALAAQNILSDLFNYFVIFLDRPFEIGDFVIIDDKLGVIEYIGIKTTRVKSLSGEQLVFSNSDLTNSRIHNYKRMQRRRIVFQVGVTYQTSPESLKEISKVLKEIVKEQKLTEFDRAHFASFGDSSLDFEIVYAVLSSDYGVYMDIQEAINLRIFESFAAMNVEFAYPTRTLYVTGDDKHKEKEDKKPYIN